MKQLPLIIEKLKKKHLSLRLLHQSDSPLYYFETNKNYYLITFISIEELNNKTKIKIKQKNLYKKLNEIEDENVLIFLRDFNSLRGAKDIFISVDKGQVQSFKLINNGLELFMEGGSSTIFKNKNNILIKVLKNTQSGRESRFENEIKFIKECSKIHGVMKIIPDEKDDKEILESCGIKHYYSLEKADYYYEKIRDLDIFKIVGIFIPLVKTLKRVHKKKIFHLDIKPDNIVWHEKMLKLIDFGIAHQDGVSDENTLRNDINGLGAKFTMAPEMKRNPLCQDYEKADIYSLIKTLWLFLTKDFKGFEGQYNKNNRFFGLKYYKNGSETVLDQAQYNIFYEHLEFVLEKCTDEDPRRRLSLDEIIKHLSLFLKAKNTKLNKEYFFTKKALNEIIKEAIIKFPANNIEYEIDTESKFSEGELSKVLFEEDLYRDLKILKCSWDKEEHININNYYFSALITLIICPIYRYKLNFKYFEFDDNLNIYIFKEYFTNNTYESIKDKQYSKIEFKDSNFYLEARDKKIKIGS